MKTYLSKSHSNLWDYKNPLLIICLKQEDLPVDTLKKLGVAIGAVNEFCQYWLSLPPSQLGEGGNQLENDTWK